MWRMHEKLPVRSAVITSFPVFIFPFLSRKEVDEFFTAAETGSTKRSALSIFKITRKLLFVFGKDDKLVRSAAACDFNTLNSDESVYLCETSSSAL